MAKTFIKITNKDIYDGIIEMKEENNKQHSEIIQHQLRTNGNVTSNMTSIRNIKWAMGFIFMLIVTIFGALAH